MGYLYLAIISVIFLLMMFWIAKEANKVSLVDVYWTLGFPILSLSAYFISDELSSRKTTLMLLVLLWSGRLFAYLAARLAKVKEDPRYQDIISHYRDHYWMAVFWRIFALQGVIQYIVGLVIFHVMFFSPEGFGALDIIGIFIFVVGFLFETFSDLQLAYFRQNNPNKVCDIGLWSLSRHPNYFGEFLIWLSFYFFALSTPYGAVYFFSPLIMLLLLLFVSGIPIIEKRKKKDPKYQEYKKRVSIFIPLPPKKTKELE